MTTIHARQIQLTKMRLRKTKKVSILHYMQYIKIICIILYIIHYTLYIIYYTPLIIGFICHQWRREGGTMLPSMAVLCRAKSAKRMNILNEKIILCAQKVLSYWPKIKVNSINDSHFFKYEGWNFNSGNYLFTTDTK